MEKKIEFLQSRTASQLAHVIDKLASDVCFEVDNLFPITPDLDSSDVTKHDVSSLNIIFLCESLKFVIDKLKSYFI